jgi:hypothetical protein
MKSSRFGLVSFVTVCALAITFAVSAIGVPALQSRQSSPEFQKLVSALSGKWSIRDVSEPTALNPEGTTAEGTEVWRMEPGGTPFVEEYHSTGLDRENYDNAFFWWDANTKQIRGLWCADFNEEGCSPFDVRWNGDQIVMNGEFQLSGKKYAWIETFSKNGLVS